MQVQIPARIDQEQKEALDRLKKLTRVPTAVRLREAVDDLLEKYADVLYTQLELPGMDSERIGKDRDP